MNPSNLVPHVLQDDASPVVHARRFAFALACSTLVLACSSGSSTATTSDAGPSDSGVASDCPALRDKQAAANCPKFDGSRYLVDCEATESSLPAACRPALSALANCFLGQPTRCTDAGTVNDETPPACRAQEDALSSCK
jgi:hypothetical protein